MEAARESYIKYLKTVFPYAPHWYDTQTDSQLCAMYTQQKKKQNEKALSFFEKDDLRIRSILDEVIEPVLGPDDMPKTEDGKIDFVKLRQRYPVTTG